MPTIQCLCNYCGHKFSEYVYAQHKIKELRCPICKDSSLQLRPEDYVDTSTDVFGYNSDTPKPDAYIKGK